MEEKPRVLKLNLSISRKFNLGNYENVDIFYSVGIELPLEDKENSVANTASRIAIETRDLHAEIKSHFEKILNIEDLPKRE